MRSGAGLNWDHDVEAGLTPRFTLDRIICSLDSTSLRLYCCCRWRQQQEPRSVLNMAELKMSMSSPSSVSELTLLARALSNPKLSHAESLDGHPNAIRNFTPHGSRRKFSSSNSLSELDSSIVFSPCSEARVLVINTGGTIGMKIQDDGNYTHVLILAADIVTKYLVSRESSNGLNIDLEM